MRNYYKEWKDQIIVYLGSKCVLCQSTENLEIDHIDPSTKLFTVCEKWTLKDKESLQAEIDKCQLLCHNCHKKKTSKFLHEKLIDTFEHGTMYAWMKRKCTCSVCLESKKEFQAQKNKLRRKGDSRGPYFIDNLPPHGTTARYYRKCRCEECRKANAEKERIRRQLKQ